MAELATIARPYAKALYQLAESRGNLQIFLKELELLARVSQMDQVQIFLNTPGLSWENKLASFVSLFEKDSFHPLIEKFLTVLAINQRLFLLLPIYEMYHKMVLAANHIEEATIYTAYALSDEELASVIRLIEERYRVRLQAKLVVDRELIGGVKVEFADQILDMSVKNELVSLQQMMIN